MVCNYIFGDKINKNLKSIVLDTEIKFYLKEIKVLVIKSTNHNYLGTFNHSQ